MINDKSSSDYLSYGYDDIVDNNNFAKGFFNEKIQYKNESAVLLNDLK